MARRTRLIALGAAVFGAHLLFIDWIARELDQPSILAAMAPPMYTRLLLPEDPPAAAPAAAPQPVRRKKRASPPPETFAASLPAPSVPPQVTPTVAEAPAAPASQAASAAEPAAETAVAAASQPTPAASAPASTTPTDTLASWPADTRVNYKLGGQFRSGPLYGDARVQWQRDGAKYQVKLDIEINPLVTMAVTSQGEVTEQGLQPRAYEETRTGGKRRIAVLGERTITLDNGGNLPRPDGVQDIVSQFVELSHRFSTGRDVLATGKTVNVWLARPGGVDLWTYDVIGSDMLDTQFGALEAFHLKPRPLPNPRGPYTVEIWFAPRMQYLPVRLRINLGEGWLDLMVDKIEQK